MDITDWEAPASLLPKGCLAFQCAGSGRFYIVRAKYLGTVNHGVSRDGQPHQMAEFDTTALSVDPDTLVAKNNALTGMVAQLGPVRRFIDLTGPIATAEDATQSAAIYVEAVKIACNSAAFDLENMLHKEEIAASLGLP